MSTQVSANARLQHEFHQVTSFVIVPVFALANAGIVISPRVLALAVRSPITIGIFVAFVAGKPLAVVAASWLTTRVSRGAIRPPVGWAGILGQRRHRRVTLTASLLIAGLAFTGQALPEAKLGVLAAAVGASLLSVAFFRLIALLPDSVRLHALLGDERQLIDLTLPIDQERDHIRGPAGAVVTVVEYGDFECPWTQMAAPTAPPRRPAGPAGPDQGHRRRPRASRGGPGRTPRTPRTPPENRADTHRGDRGAGPRHQSRPRPRPRRRMGITVSGDVPDQPSDTA